MINLENLKIVIVIAIKLPLIIKEVTNILIIIFLESIYNFFFLKKKILV